MYSNSMYKEFQQVHLIIYICICNGSTVDLNINLDRIGGVMVSVLASSVVGRGFDQTKEYKIGI